MHYVVVGTDHTLQVSTCEDRGLEALLKCILSSFSVVLVAEEVKTSEAARVNDFETQVHGVY